MTFIIIITITLFLLLPREVEVNSIFISFTLPLLLCRKDYVSYSCNNKVFIYSKASLIRFDRYLSKSYPVSTI